VSASENSEGSAFRVKEMVSVKPGMAMYLGGARISGASKDRKGRRRVDWEVREVRVRPL
jgi:hypothetical protein